LDTAALTRYARQRESTLVEFIARGVIRIAARGLPRATARSASRRQLWRSREPAFEDIPRARSDLSATQPWTNGELAIIQTELSPATLYHAQGEELSFFTHMPETGIGGADLCGD
jgi:hypothetical protein